MKNKVIFAFCLCLVFVTVAAFNYSRYQPPQWIEQVTDDEDWAFRVSEPKAGSRSGTAISAEIRFEILPDGTLVLYDTSGNTTWSKQSDSIVMIDDLDDLSTFSGAAAGQSYFQTEAGRTYYVDFHAIYTDDKTATTGVTSSSWSGVTAILPEANAASDRDTVTIGIVCTGGTGYATAMAGVTTVQVWPALLTGATRFGEPSVGNQNMMKHNESSATRFMLFSADANLGNTQGDLAITHLNEMATWKLFNSSAVSAQIVSSTADR